MNKKNRTKRYCIAAGCRNTEKNSNHAFFYLPQRPKDAERLRKWLVLLGREDLLAKDIKKCTRTVCSAHFDSSSIKIKKTLREDAVPTLLLANQADQPNSSSSKAQPVSAQFGDATMILPKSTEGVASYSTLPSGSAQIEDKDKMITSEKIVETNTETQTNNQEPSSEKQTQTDRSNIKKRKLSGKLKECKSKQRKISKIKEMLEAKNKPITCNDPDEEIIPNVDRMAE